MCFCNAQAIIAPRLWNKTSFTADIRVAALLCCECERVRRLFPPLPHVGLKPLFCCVTVVSWKSWTRPYSRSSCTIWNLGRHFCVFPPVTSADSLHRSCIETITNASYSPIQDIAVALRAARRAPLEALHRLNLQPTRPPACSRCPAHTGVRVSLKLEPSCNVSLFCWQSCLTHQLQ